MDTELGRVGSTARRLLNAVNDRRVTSRGEGTLQGGRLMKYQNPLAGHSLSRSWNSLSGKLSNSGFAAYLMQRKRDREGKRGEERKSGRVATIFWA